ncbi:DEAD/DEAH box helicase [Sphingobacterium sp.]|uniref:DEAD/DEAH box helicase n=1 Tax=Sphingobacterium sp. TaxID=341027 RepID=UPI002FD9F88D
MTYSEFLESKIVQFKNYGFDIDPKKLNPLLKDFQQYGIITALKKGKFAFFFDCGLGKTFCQLEWAHHVATYTQSPVLILAPLAIVQQTIDEGLKFGIDVYQYDFACTPLNSEPDIFITNYDQLKNIDTSVFSGIVLDESSILKGRDGKLSSLILTSFKNTPYKLACSATPSPNDHMELGQHSEFLNGMTYQEMLAMYFVHDGGETSKWRLRKHAEDDFWKYVCTWSMAIDTPATLGFDCTGYNLPEIEYIEHIIEVENNTRTLFNDVAVSATDLHKDLKRSFDDRINKTIELVNSTKEQCIVWALSNDETNTLKKLLPEAINVQGSDKPEYKAKYLNGFAKNEFQTLITKTSIASMGMNYQNCHNMIFISYDFKFEQFYQAVRRCYRFGQKEKVKVHLLIPASQANVRKSILEKQANHFNMIRQMSKYSAESDYKKNKPEREYHKTTIQLPKFA